MGLLKRHSEKLAFALLVALCTGFVLKQGSTSDAPWEEELRRNTALIQAALANPKDPSPAYEYSPQALAHKPRYLDSIVGRFADEATPAPSVPAFVAYPQPARPLVEPRPPPPGVREEFAWLGQLTNMKLSAEPGRVFLAFTPPRSLKYMELVRVEIFRNTTADNLEDTPFAVIQYEPATAEPSPLERLPPARHGRPEAALTTPPPAAAGSGRFVDTRVEAHKTYYYRLRAVGRMTVPPRARLPNAGLPGGAGITVVRPPKEALPLLSGQSGAAALYATPLSAPQAVTAESNCKIRLAGTVGTIPPRDCPPHLLNAGYKGSFSVCVWLPEAQVWGEATTYAGVGERIQGKVLFTNPATKQLDAYAFDTGYELLEIKWGTITTRSCQALPLLGPGGAPLLSPAGKLVTEERVVQSTAIANEVAVLKNTSTGTLKEFPKCSAKKE